MMVELGIGDAYGACFENTSVDFVREHNDLHYELHPRFRRGKKVAKQPSLVPSGCYTDDTQMSIGIAEMMLDPEFNWEDDVKMADVFLDCFKRDERRGYTPYLFLTMMNSKSGKELLSKLGGKSDKSGAFMRAAPLGLYADLNEVMEKAALQAMLTHDSWVGRNTAIGAAMMAHYFYHNIGPKSGMVQWLRDQHFKHTLHAAEAFSAFGEVVQPWEPGMKVRVHGWDCLEACIYAIEESETMADLLQTCVGYTGDVDTVGAVAMAVGSCCKEIEQNIPEQLYEGFEDADFGRKFLADLDKQLMEAFPCVGSP